MRRRAGWLVPALAVMLMFSGCAQANTDLTAESAAQLQSHVVSVAETAATGDCAAAMAELDALQAALDAARERGEVSDARATSIQAALDVVRADLLQLAEVETPSAPVEAPVSETPADPKPEKTKKSDGDAPGQGNGGNGNNGNGVGNGVGNGNGTGTGGNGGNGGKGG